jgi:hypothetical protein
MTNPLSEALRQFKPSGENGFEGLIAQLLQHLTGRRFYLAQSGSQEGRDMSSRDYGANIIAVECKRYNKNTTLDHRELSGELGQIRRSIPDLDIWVLVATRDVDSKLVDNLTQEAINLGIHFEVIAEDINKPDSLDVLCAQELPGLPDNYPIIEVSVTSDYNFEQIDRKTSLSENNFTESITLFSRNVVWGIWDTGNSRESLKQFQDINSKQKLREDFRDIANQRLDQLKQEQPNNWRKGIINISLNRWQRNSWAKQWFNRFMNTTDRVMAWSYFRLFLRCLDRRLWLWKDNIIDNTSSDSSHQLYFSFFEDNMNEVNNSIKNNEKEI